MLLQRARQKEIIIALSADNEWHESDEQAEQLAGFAAITYRDKIRYQIGQIERDSEKASGVAKVRVSASSIQMEGVGQMIVHVCGFESFRVIEADL